MVTAADAEERVVTVYGDGEKRMADLERYDVYWDAEQRRWRVYWGDKEGQ